MYYEFTFQYCSDEPEIEAVISQSAVDAHIPTT